MDILKAFNKDIRHLVMLALFVVLVISVYATKFSALPAVLLVFLSTVVFDAVIAYALYRQFSLPKSGIISGLILAMVVYAEPSIWYGGVVAAAVAMLTKHFLRINGRHIFNPGNLGALAAAALFQPIAETVWWAPKEGLATWAMMVFGLLVLWRFKRFHLWLTFVVVYAAILLLAKGTSITPFLMATAQTGTFWLFSAIMLVEPMTTPMKRNGRIAYAVVTAVAAYALTLYPLTAPYGSLSFGTIAVGNLLVPLINKYVKG